MKTISVAVSEADYEVFREAARQQGRPIAHLIREAMARYREQELERRSRLSGLPILIGHRATGSLPGRHEIYDEIFEDGP